MKKILFIAIALMLMFFTGCQGLKTPEELIGPPEVDIEKKYLKDIVLEFLPSNSDLLNLPYVRGSKGAGSISAVNLDDKSQDEIVSIFREKNTRAVGLLILTKDGEEWQKSFEIKLDATELSDYELIDLDADGIKEILLGYFRSTDAVKELLIIGFDDGVEKIIYQTQYLALDMNRISENQYVDIAFSSKGSENNNRFQILNYKNKMMQIVGEMIYPENNEIYKIFYGNVNSTQKAYFIDMYVDNQTGRTDIVQVKDQSLYSVVRKNAMKELTQEIPVESRDLDGDGIVEAIQNKVLESDEGLPVLVINSSYSIDFNEEMLARTDFYESYEDNIRVSIPHTSGDSVRAKKTLQGILFSYYSNKLGQNVPFLEVMVVDNPEIEDIGYGYTQVDERYGKTIIAKRMETEVLEGVEKNDFEKIMSSLQNFSDYIRFID